MEIQDGSIASLADRRSTSGSMAARVMRATTGAVVGEAPMK